MYHRLLVILATVSVIGGVEDRGTSLPFPFSSLPPFAPIYESVKNPLCKEHGLAFLRELQNLKLWAVQMYDASGKVPSGVLGGNVQWLGDDRECMRVSSKPGAANDDPENIQGQYCSFRIFADPKEKNQSTNGDLQKIFDLIHSDNMMINYVDDGLIFFPSFSPLSMGMCVPHSCTIEDIEAALEEWFAPLNSSSVNIRLLTTPYSCVKGERDYSVAYYVMTFSAAMTVIGLLGSLYERRKEKKGEMKHQGILMRILLAFSFRSNLRALLDTSAPKNEISCLNGIRSMLSLVLFFLHRGLLMLLGSIQNRSEMAAWLVGPKSMILRAFWNYVDTFVVMSGLLTSYYAVKSLQEGRKLNILKMYVRRYLKLTPMFVMSTLISMSTLDLVTTDAHYSRLVKHYIMCCKEAWWNVITYTNTFRGLENMCSQMSHQLETDMQMYILSPFIILLLWKMGKYSILPISCAMAALSVLKVYKLYSRGLGTILYYGFPLTQMVDSANEFYLNFLHRLIPYIFGVALGYLLRVRKENFKLRSGRFFLSGILAFWGAYYSFLHMVHVSYPGYVFDSLEHAFFGVFQPLLWSYSICWFIFACANGQAELFDKFLSWKGFLITNRISYAFYLIQMPIMLSEITRSTNTFYVAIISLFDLNILFISLGAAIWLTLLFLFPIGTLWTIFTESPPKDHKDVKKR